MSPEEIGDERVPLVEEVLRVDKRAVVSDRVFVHKQVRTHEAVVEIALSSEELEVERVSIGREVSEVPAVREEDGVTVIPLVEEELVVSKRLVLREEVRIRRRRTTSVHTAAGKLRREAVVIEQGTGEQVMSTSNSYETGGTAEHQVVAMFDTYAEARAARDQLASAGVPSSAMDLLDRNAEATDTNFVYEHTDEGFWGAIKHLFVPENDTPSYVEGVRRGHALLIVRPSAGQHDTVVNLLEQSNPVDLDTREAEWRNEGWSGVGDKANAGTSGLGARGGQSVTAGADTPSTVQQQASRSRTASTAADTGEQAIPIVEEELRIGKRAVSSGSARIRSYVLERPVQEQVRLREEHIEVERRPASQLAGMVPEDAFRERTIEVTATSEEAVVAKEARVVGEVLIRKEVNERVETVSDTVRRTEVEIEQDGKVMPGSSTPKPV